MNAVAMQRKIGARTGGLSTAMIYEQPTGPGGTVADPLDLVAYLAVRGKATVDKSGDMFSLAHALLTDANLKDGQAKVVELLREKKSNLETAFISSGNSFAGARLAARNTLHGYVGELTQGVTYYEAVKEMLTQAKDDWPTLLGRLEKVRETLLSQEGLIINLTADPDALDAVRPTVDAFAAKLPKTAKADPTAVPWRKAVTLLPAVNEAYAITTQVHYVAAGMRAWMRGRGCMHVLTTARLLPSPHRCTTWPRACASSSLAPSSTVPSTLSRASSHAATCGTMCASWAARTAAAAR